MVRVLKPAHIKARKQNNIGSIEYLLSVLRDIKEIKFQYPEYIGIQVDQEVLKVEKHINNAKQACVRIVDLLEKEIESQ